MKKIFLLILVFFIHGCGFTSVYKYQENQDLLVNVKINEGDKLINNFIKNDLKIISKENSSNIYDISFISNYEKEELAKDKTGKITDYKISMNIKFIINSEQNKEINFNENFKIKNTNEKFEQTQYEKEIKRNFSKNVFEKLVFELLKLNDN